MDSFKQRLKNKELLIGTIITLPSPEVAEILAGLSFDWLWVDMEHAPFSIRDVQRIVRAADGRCPCVVRTPSADEVWMKRALDTGAVGVIIPHVSTPEEARNIVRYCKYPPDGTRSVGVARAHGYGLSAKEYMDRANQDVLVILQIEDVEGVRNAESIAGVDGADAIFIGPYDLSGSMGKLGEVDDPDVKRNIEKVRVACTDAGMPVGIFGMDVDSATTYINDGFTLIALGMDTAFLIRAVGEALKALGR
jgi:2-dehydro-3-deoxyglucarate aldolase/4-hydroxy-2-oxoheptanedioate aldolase